MKTWVAFGAQFADSYSRLWYRAFWQETTTITDEPAAYILLRLYPEQGGSIYCCNVLYHVAEYGKQGSSLLSRTFQISFLVIFYIVWILVRIHYSSCAAPDGWVQRVFSTPSWQAWDRPSLVPDWHRLGRQATTHFQLKPRFGIRGSICSVLHTSILT